MTNKIDKFIHYNTLINIIITLFFALFLLAMQYLKHIWVTDQPDQLLDMFTILHAELVGYIFIAFLLIVIIRKNWIVFIVSAAYYALSLLDFIAWSTINRPFHPIDLIRSIELLTYYPQFFYVNHKMGFKIAVFASVPVLAGAMMCWLRKRGNLRLGILGKVILSCTAIFFLSYLATMPFVFSTLYIHENSMVRIGEEMVYKHQIRHTSLDQTTIYNMFGTAPVMKIMERDGADRSPMNVILFVLETTPYSYYPDLGQHFMDGLCRIPRGLPRG